MKGGKDSTLQFKVQCACWKGRHNHRVERECLTSELGEGWQGGEIKCGGSIEGTTREKRRQSVINRKQEMKGTAIRASVSVTIRDELG